MCTRNFIIIYFCVGKQLFPNSNNNDNNSKDAVHNSEIYSNSDDNNKIYNNVGDNKKLRKRKATPKINRERFPFKKRNVDFLDGFTLKNNKNLKRKGSKINTVKIHPYKKLKKDNNNKNNNDNNDNQVYRKWSI